MTRDDLDTLKWEEVGCKVVGETSQEVSVIDVQKVTVHTSPEVELQKQ